MSVRTMARVWDYSRHAGNDLLMLLAIADFADDDGRAYPSVPKLAKKCRTSPRNANRVLAELRKSGELEVRQNEGPYGTNLYQIRLPLTELSPLTKRSALTKPSRTPDGTVPTPLTKPSDEPSVNHQEPSTMVQQPVDSKAADHCPHDEIRKLWAEILPNCRQPKVWSPARQQLLRQRWKEDQQRQNLEWWRRLFGYVSKSDFLMGRTSSSGRKPFDLGLEWLLKAENFAKTIEGAYHPVEVAE